MPDFDLDPDSLRYDDRGLVACVAQDVASGAVLMLAWADRQAVERTLATGEAHFWSRSRQALWRKGETSGNVLKVRQVRPDCDRDALLLRVEPAGPACHRGTRTCFEPNAARLELGWLAEILDERRRADPAASYTARLLARGLPRIAQKVGEEATETVVAALAGDDDELASETADLLYHLLVLLLAAGVDPQAVARALAERHAVRSAPAAGGDPP
ncbi:MAG: bifunctional phosphoribosyl-AMP cyclohydrolase/phosphoribosyl-ATP diphosphatase HisIE [Acidobacteria bacterium]|nr:MAG: bifunctional phosphoribosyl-AMP cyclohydrolase/phosphoribosyl-ATP diphosphatase HisIE [Acidobacteriota bacterium]